MDASEIYSKRLNAKEVILPKQREFIFPIADGRIKTPGGDQELRTSTLIRKRPIRGESQRDFLGESEGSLPPGRDSFPDAGEAINDFWSTSGNFIHRHHVEPRVKLHSPREESFPVPLKYIDVSRTLRRQTWMLCKNAASMTIGISMDQEICLILGKVSLSLLYCVRNLQMDMWSGERLTKRQATSRPDHLWPELWKKLARNAKLGEKQKWSIEKPKLDNARRLRGTYFADLEDKEFKETIKNARKKMEAPMAPAMPCKTCKKGKHGATRGKSNEIKSKTCVYLGKPVNPQGCVWKNLYQHMRTILQEKGDNSQQHYNLAHKFIPMPQAMKIPAAKAAVDKEWEKLEKISAWNLTKVKSKKEVIDEARTKGIKVHLMDICYLKNAELETKAPKI